MLLGAALFAAGCDSGGSGPADDLGTSTTFSFAEGGGAVVPEDSADATYTLEVVVSDPGFKQLSVDVVFDTASTVAFSELSGIEETTTLTFPESATDGASQTLSFQVMDDQEAGEMAEEVAFVLRNPQQGSIGDQSRYTLTVEDDDLPPVPVAEARALGNGEPVAVEAVITRRAGDNTYVQDASGAGGASGLVIRQSSGAFREALEAGDVGPGDRVRFAGTKGTFNGLEQINLETYQLVEEEAGVPAPQVVTLSEIQMNGETYESELVRVNGLTIQDDADSLAAGTNYTVADDGGATLTLRIDDSSFYAGAAAPGGTFDVIGPLGQFNGSDTDLPNEGYQLFPLTDGDFTNLEDVGEGGVLLSEDFQDEALAPFAAFSVSSAFDWGLDSFEGAFYASINGFSQEGGDASNDWLISPALNFDEADEETLTFDNRKRFSGPDLIVKVSTNYSGSGSPEAADWTDITDEVTLDTTTDDFDFVASGEIDLSDFAGEAVYIAFQYVSDGVEEGEAAGIQIDNVAVQEGSGDGFPEPPGRP